MTMSPCLRNAGCSAGLLAILATAPAMADGTLTHMSGLVSVQKLDGRVQHGVVDAKVLSGETVSTGKGGYVRMEMSDGGEIVLRPESQLKVESYVFDKAKPTEDNFVFSVVKGGLRTITGLIGKRGSREAYKLKTSTSTIGIRGTQFDLRICQANCGALADGTYLAVRFGAVQTSNDRGSLTVAAGQVVHVPPQLPPVMLPRDPGIGFTAPPVIPKLDERKKRAAAAAAAPTTEQSKPEASPVRPQSNAPRSDMQEAGDSSSESPASSKTGRGQSTQTTPSATITETPPMPEISSDPTLDASQPIQSASAAECSVQ